MNEVRITTPFIKLDQSLKLANLCASGGEAKEIIQVGKVLVNGEVELRRGKKLINGDIVEFKKDRFIIRQDGGHSDNQKTSS